MDLRNNVIYNWIDNGVYGGEGMNVNIVNNYYKPGPDTKSGAKNKRIAAIGIRTSEYTKHDTANPNQWDVMWHVWGDFYVDGNINSKNSDVTNDNWTNGIYNQIANSSVDNTFTDVTKDTIRLEKPIRYEQVTTHSAEQAFTQVLGFAGASLHRDALDEIMVSDARNGATTYTGSGCKKGIINSQDDLKPANAGSDWSPWPALNSTTAPLDSDKDGIPDEWENANGLNKDNANDGKTIADNGYTNLENYLNSLVADITAKQNEGGTVMSCQQIYGESTGILNLSAAPESDNRYFNLQGMVVSRPTSGIYIQNGKKILMK